MKKKITTVLLCLGVALVLGAVGLFIYTQVATDKAMENAADLVDRMYSLMPPVKNGAPDDRYDTTMPMLDIDGTDFVGIIEVPLYERTLPICGKWNSSQVADYPCRYMGSMYDGSLIVGGSDNEGQFDFATQISVYDNVFVTDTTGLRYKYEVSEIKRTKDVSTENLDGMDAHLVLFARNTYSLDYTVICCKMA